MSKPINEILKPGAGVKINGSLWLESADGRFLGPGPIELLGRIAETGSIRAAAKQMQMSYKKAWELIDHLNAQCTAPIVIPQAGGKKGGGSELTPEAMELIKYHQGLRKRFAAFLEKETQSLKL